jgi:hypothetical protein
MSTIKLENKLESLQTLIMQEYEETGRSYKISRYWPSYVGRADRLHTLYEKQCNGLISKGEEQEIERMEQELRQELLQYESVECVKFNRDPRGAPVKVYFDRDRAEEGHTADFRI